MMKYIRLTESFKAICLKYDGWGIVLIDDEFKLRMYLHISQEIGLIITPPQYIPTVK